MHFFYIDCGQALCKTSPQSKDMANSPHRSSELVYDSNISRSVFLPRKSIFLDFRLAPTCCLSICHHLLFLPYFLPANPRAATFLVSRFFSVSRCFLAKFEQNFSKIFFRSIYPTIFFSTYSFSGFWLAELAPLSPALASKEITIFETVLPKIAHPFLLPVYFSPRFPTSFCTRVVCLRFVG